MKHLFPVQSLSYSSHTSLPFQRDIWRRRGACAYVLRCGSCGGGRGRGRAFGGEDSPIRNYDATLRRCQFWRRRQLLVCVCVCVCVFVCACMCCVSTCMMLLHTADCCREVVPHEHLAHKSVCPASVPHPVTCPLVFIFLFFFICALHQYTYTHTRARARTHTTQRLEPRSRQTLQKRGSTQLQQLVSPEINKKASPP
jgi:hypothetical protein